MDFLRFACVIVEGQFGNSMGLHGFAVGRLNGRREFGITRLLDMLF